MAALLSLSEAPRSATIKTCFSQRWNAIDEFESNAIDMSRRSKDPSSKRNDAWVSISEQSGTLPKTALQLANSRRPLIFIARVFSCSSKALILSPDTCPEFTWMSSRFPVLSTIPSALLGT